MNHFDARNGIKIRHFDARNAERSPGLPEPWNTGLRVVFWDRKRKCCSASAEQHFVVPVASFYINIYGLTTQLGPLSGRLFGPQVRILRPRVLARPALDLVESRLTTRFGQRPAQSALGATKVGPFRAD